MQHRRLARRSSGFTLIELLLVVGIIVTLLSLTIGAAMKGAAWVYQRNTETTMRKVTIRLNRHILSLPQQARDWSTPAAILAQANGDTQRAEAIKIKYLYKWSFPATYNEAQFNLVMSTQLYAPSGYPLAATMYQKLLQNFANQLQPTSLSPAQQNSAILLLAFESVTGSSQDELSPLEIAQQDANATVPAGTSLDRNRWLIDAWGSPILYLRNGTLNVASISPENPNLGLAPLITPATNAWLIEQATLFYRAKQGADPEDPGNVLRDLTWLNQPADNSGSVPPPLVRPNIWTLAAPFPLLPAGNNNVCFQNRFFHDVTGGVYAPIVLFSAGPDRNLLTYYDNFTCYGLQLNVSENN